MCCTPVTFVIMALNKIQVSISRRGLFSSLDANLWPLLPDGQLGLRSLLSVAERPGSDLVSAQSRATSG